MTKKIKEEEEIVDSIKIAAQAFFKANKKDIYLQGHEPYKVSTGVLGLDFCLGGGILAAD